VNAPAPPPAGATNVLAPGVSWYMVFVAPKILAPNGDVPYEMHGPFGDLATATQYASAKPGSLIVVNLVLHQAAALSPQLQAAMAANVKA
jgi:hypothetical protein